MSSSPGFTKFGRHSLRYPSSVQPNVRPSSAASSAAAGVVTTKALPPHQIRTKRSKKMNKFTRMFRRTKETDYGGFKQQHPAFADLEDYIYKRPSSPDSAIRQRASSVNNKMAFKIGLRSAKKSEECDPFFLWKPTKVTCRCCRMRTQLVTLYSCLLTSKPLHLPTPPILPLLFRQSAIGKVYQGVS